MIGAKFCRKLYKASNLPTIFLHCGKIIFTFSFIKILLEFTNINIGLYGSEIFKSLLILQMACKLLQVTYDFISMVPTKAPFLDFGN